MVNFEIKGISKDVASINKEVSQFISEIGIIFKFTIDIKIIIRIHDSRQSYDKKLGKPTKDWEVGNTNQKNEIDILDIDIFEKESSHTRSEFYPILKHEIVHIFTRIYSEDKCIPLWLNEGISMFFAGQVDKYEKQNIFIENNFTEKISTEHGWNIYSDYGAYGFSCLFLNYLIKKFSVEKILSMLKKLDKNYYQSDFEKKFKNVFGITLSKAEIDFVRYINLVSLPKS